MRNIYKLNFDETEFEPYFLKEFLTISLPVFQKYGKEIFLIGAAGRNFAFSNCLEIKNSFRMTKDADIAVAVNGLNDYSAFISDIIQLQQVVKTEIEHRFSFANNNQLIDILPFSKTDFPDILKWPPDYKIQMTMTGFEEAWNNAYIIEFTDLFSMRVVSPVSLLILKFIAFHDRKNSKDAEDIGLLFRLAFNIYKSDIFDYEQEWLSADDFDAETAGIRYMGKLIRKAVCCNMQLKVILDQIIETEIQSDYSVFIAELNRNRNYEKSRKWLEVLKMEIG